MAKYKVGYTTGVFDVFHVGHLNILERAKERCDCLIVGVSTDELVQTYKHKTPVIPFEDRMRIVAALRVVDKVVPQTSMDKREAWENLHYDVMFHGDDWKNTAMYNEEIRKLGEVGVDVVFLPHTPGVSTSELLNQIREKDS